VIIQPNFHGSTGFGLKFHGRDQGTVGRRAYEDQMKAVDTALTWPYVDTTRIAAAGASYGGYMANWVEGHTDRFRTIVSHDGLYDLLAAIYSSISWRHAAGVQGHPWQNPQALIEQAPVTTRATSATPMLIIHGGNDYRVDPSQGLSMFQVLQASTSRRNFSTSRRRITGCSNPPTVFSGTTRYSAGSINGEARSRGIPAAAHCGVDLRTPRMETRTSRLKAWAAGARDHPCRCRMTHQ